MVIKKFDIEKIIGKTVLVFGAHPDDVEFGAGGTISLMSGNNEVAEIVATDGGWGTHKTDLNRGDLAKQRFDEAEKSSKLLGIKKIIFWSYPDGELSSWDKHLRLKITKTILK